MFEVLHALASGAPGFWFSGQLAGVGETPYSTTGKEAAIIRQRGGTINAIVLYHHPLYSICVVDKRVKGLPGGENLGGESRLEHQRAPEGAQRIGDQQAGVRTTPQATEVANNKAVSTRQSDGTIH